MHVTYSIEHGKPWWTQQTTGNGPIALAVSDWDGVHRGHVALAHQVAELAERNGGHAVALLPWPSPGTREQPAARLTTLEERIAALDALGCFESLVVMPAPELDATPEAMLDQWRSLGNLRCLLVDRTSDRSNALIAPTGMEEVARQAGISVEQVPTGGDPGESAERIRTLVGEGSMRQVTAALGYPYTVTGVVVGGDQRGRLLGFPTANLLVEPSKLIPGNGIYAAWVWLPGATTPWPAAVSIGVRPTFERDGRRLIEAHLLDASMDLYGVELQVQFVEWLRAELRFDGVEALIAQMNSDRERTHDILRAEAPARRLGSSVGSVTRLADVASA